MLPKHNKRIGKYEFRTCDKYLMSEGELIKAEIVEWGISSCWTITIFNCEDSYWHSREVSNRMVECISDLDFQEVFKYAHKYLEENTIYRCD